MAGPVQEGDDLVVGGWAEVPVPFPDGPQLWRRLDTDQVVDVPAELGDGVGGRDGDGKHDPGCALRPGDPAGGPGGRAGGDAIVDDHRGPSRQRHRGPVAAEAAGPTFELDPFAFLDYRQLLGGHPGCVGHRVVDDSHAALTDGSHGQLRLERHAQFADHDHIERGVKGAGDLERDWDTAAGQSDNDHVLAARVLQPLRQPAAGICSIHERHRNLLALKSCRPGRSTARARA